MDDGALTDAAAAAVDGASAVLFDALRAEPWAHDFFALLRRVDALHPEAPRFGRALRAAQEPIRLGQDAELDFAPAALSSFDDAGRTVPRLGVRFFGLLGPQGPMPLHLTEYVRERQRFRNDPTAARFLDVFHHRLLALFYRAWADAQPTVQHDRPADDRFSVWLGAAAGLGTFDDTARRMPLGRAAQLHQTGLLASRSRHPEGLAKLLADSFGVPVRIESNVPNGLAIERVDRSRLGGAGLKGVATRGAGRAALGRSASIGHKVRDRQCRFRVVLGPLSRDAYAAMLPGGDAWPTLRDWIGQYAGLDLQWDVALVLAADDVPAPRLGRRIELGVASWLGRDRDGRPASRMRTKAGLVAATAGPSTGAGVRGAPRAGARASPHDRCDLHVRPETTFLLRRCRGAS